VNQAVATTPLSGIDSVLLDLDGVVYLGEHPIAHACESIAQLESLGVAAAFVTNNAARTPERVAEHLRSLGIQAVDADIVTSAQAGARLVREMLGEGPHPVLAVGGPGVAAALRERGMVAVDRAEDRPRAVLQGFGFDLTWTLLAEASLALATGIPWVATNEDVSIPLRGGRAPGNGAFVQAVSLAVGRTPDLVAGKPHRPLIDESLERIGARRALMIGDRLDTDIEAGTNADVPTLLVMTGVTDVVDVLLAPPQQRPDFISLDLRGMYQGFPPVVGDGSQWNCGAVSVEVGDQLTDLRFTGAGSFEGLDGAEAADPDVWSSAMRSLAAAVWHRRDDGGDEAMAEGSDRELGSRLSLLPEVATLQAGVDRMRHSTEG
jgi:glycerol-1-phosphatase